MTVPFFSIITPCFNYAHVLEQTFKSLLAQSFTAWECLVVDDASTDHTAQTARRYADADPRFLLLSHATNQGLAAARNTGINQASGRFLIFLDADDLLAPEALRRLAEGIEARGGDEGTVYCLPWRLFRLRSNHAYVSKLRQIHGLDGDVTQNLLTFAKGNAFPVCAGVMSRERVIAVGGFDTPMRSLEDYEFWLRVVRANLCFRQVATAGFESACLIRVHAGTLSRKLGSMYRREVELRKAWAESRFFEESPEATFENDRRLRNRRSRLVLISLFSTQGKGSGSRPAWQAMPGKLGNRWELLSSLVRAGTGLLFGVLLGRPLQRLLWKRDDSILFNISTDSVSHRGRIERAE